MKVKTSMIPAKLLSRCPECIFNSGIFSVNFVAEDSVLCVGVAGKFKTCNRYPGRQISSLGYHSRDGKIIYDGRSQANTQGHRFTEGMCVAALCIIHSVF